MGFHIGNLVRIRFSCLIHSVGYDLLCLVECSLILTEVGYSHNMFVTPVLLHFVAGYYCLRPLLLGEIDDYFFLWISISSTRNSSQY